MTGTTTGNLRARRTAVLLAATLSAVIMLGGTFPASAHAITRRQVVSRGAHWVKKRIPYSQARYHQGYRQDCSGFVSMAWKVKTSYTTYSITRVSFRIKKYQLKPGDAVLMPGKGHVVLFQKWANRSHTRFVALEEPGRRIGHAVRMTRTWRAGSTPLRRRGIRSGIVRVAAKPQAQDHRCGTRPGHPHACRHSARERGVVRHDSAGGRNAAALALNSTSLASGMPEASAYPARCVGAIRRASRRDRTRRTQRAPRPRAPRRRC